MTPERLDKIKAFSAQCRAVWPFAHEPVLLAALDEVIAALEEEEAENTALKNAPSMLWGDANVVPDYDQVVLALVGDDRHDAVIVQAYAEYDYALDTGASVTWFTAADHIRIREEILAWAPMPALPDGCAYTPRPSHLRR